MNFGFSNDEPDDDLDPEDVEDMEDKSYIERIKVLLNPRMVL